MRYMIEFIKKLSVMIYINYFIVIFISRQISFIISNIDKFNLRLIRASQYFFIFNLIIRLIDCLYTRLLKL